MTERHHIDGIVYVLPRHEGGPRWVKRIGPLAVGINWRWSSINLGVDLLKAGVLVAIGPAYFWVAHIEKQIAAFEGSAPYHRKAPHNEW